MLLIGFYYLIMKGTKRGLFIFPLNLSSFSISAVHIHFLLLEQIIRSYKEYWALLTLFDLLDLIRGPRITENGV